MTLTNSNLFAAFLLCPTKCFLLSNGERGSGNDYAQWLESKEETYCQGTSNWLRKRTPDGGFTDAPATENLRLATWQLALNVGIRTASIESRLHAVERLPCTRMRKPTQFVPIRFFGKNKLTKNDKLAVAFDALCLSEALGRDVPYGRIIHGPDYALRSVKVQPLLRKVRTAVEQIAALSAKGSPPDLVLNRHCSECEFRDRCRAKLLEKDDLSLLASMTMPERKEYHGNGIFTITQLSYAFRPRRRPKHLRDRREKYHHALKALAIREQKIYIVGKPALQLQGTPVYVDVEGIPDRDFYYLVGLRVGTGATAVQHSLWAQETANEQSVWTRFIELVEQIENPTLVHYGSYEAMFFRRMTQRYGTPAINSRAANALSAAINLVTIIFAQFYFPTFSNGIKEIATYLGFKWHEVNPSGVQTIQWREKWEQSREDCHKARLITYNRQDCEALGLVTQAVARLVTEGTAPTAQVIRTDELKDAHESRWRDFSSPISELVDVTNAAHWDYQRERVYYRSSGVLKRLRKRKPSAPRWIVDSIVPAVPVRVCPECGQKGASKGPIRSRAVQELIFGRFSLKRRLIQYDFQPQWCRHCKKVFGVEEMLLKPGKRRKYGRSLVAYFFYQIIELYIPAQVVLQSANKLFGLGLNTGTLAYFKREMTAYYTHAQQEILRRIVAGPLVHADETFVSIKGQRGYIWVLANMHEVAFVYAPTREAAVIQGLLDGFKGVLVSDFYAAYDSISCPQQRCLIHLARDLNGELLDHPFDDELKMIIKSFGVLVRAILDEVDKHGLKRRFLHKHHAAVDRFYRTLIDVECRSPAAAACAERFQRNRGRLFTFLDYDGVPWNNNNAEHAIKAFAKLREVLHGCSTETSIKETLVLLSICQTCKYQGLDFLGFLRSGEKDLESYSERRARRRVKAVVQ